MGKFSYICRGCGENLRAGEDVVLRHVRHGVVVGEVTGVYDGYGSTDGESAKNDGFRSETGVNSADEIDRSDASFADSVNNPGRKRVYRHPIDGPVNVDLFEFRELTQSLHLLTHGDTRENRTKVRSREFTRLANDVFDCLPFAAGVKSGVVGWHAACLGVGDPGLVPSEADPDQGCGRARLKFKGTVVITSFNYADSVFSFTVNHDVSFTFTLSEVSNRESIHITLRSACTSGGRHKVTTKILNALKQLPAFVNYLKAVCHTATAVAHVDLEFGVDHDVWAKSINSYFNGGSLKFIIATTEPMTVDQHCAIIDNFIDNVFVPSKTGYNVGT